MNSLKIFALFLPSVFAWWMLPPNSEWYTVPSLLGDPRCDFAAAVVSTNSRKKALIVAGGDSADGMLNSVEMFNPDAQEWTRLPPMRTKRCECAGAAIGSQFFVIGGRDSNMEMFDLKTKKWTTLPPMSTSRSLFAAVAVGQSIYVFGGHEDEASHTAEKYDIAESKWTPLPSMSTARYGCAAAAINNTIYVVGAGKGSTVDCYDIDSGEWRESPPMDYARHKCAAASFGNYLFVVGGRGLELNSAEVFDAETQIWEQLPEMGMARNGCGAAILKNKLYAVGGRDGWVWIWPFSEKLCIQKKETLAPLKWMEDMWDHGTTFKISLNLF